MKKIAFFALTVAVALTACSKEDGGNRNEADEARAIEFRPVVEKTRASLTDDTTDFNSFFTHAYRSDENYLFSFFEGAVYNGDAGWTYAPKKYYPTEAGVSVNFYAYAPVKDPNMTTPTVDYSGNVSFGYTVPTDQSRSNIAKDLLVSRKTEMTSGQIDFMFDHALSAVTFSAINPNPGDSELVYIINSVSIMNLANMGTFIYDNDMINPFAGSWSDNTFHTETYQAAIPETGVAVSNERAGRILSENDYLMVLPQMPDHGTLTPEGTPSNNGAFVVVTFSLKDGEGKFIYRDKPRYLTLDPSFEFAMGTRYNFEVGFDASDAITLNVQNLGFWN